MPFQKRTVIKANSRHTSTIIFLHGLGDTGKSWATILKRIRPSYMKIICPTANVMPVTLLGGLQVPAWFDINVLDINGPEDEDGVNKSKHKIHTLINAEIKKGISSNRILLGGFSQGGALALYSALTFNKPLGGLIILSCWLPLHNKFSSYIEAPDNLPIFQAHGKNDKICPLHIGQLTHKLLKTYSRNALFIIYNGLSHNVAEDELIDIKLFIEQHIEATNGNGNGNHKYWCCFGKAHSDSTTSIDNK